VGFSMCGMIAVQKSQTPPPGSLFYPRHTKALGLTNPPPKHPTPPTTAVRGSDLTRMFTILCPKIRGGGEYHIPKDVSTCSHLRRKVSRMAQPHEQHVVRPHLIFKAIFEDTHILLAPHVMNLPFAACPGIREVKGDRKRLCT
jgi:hypothetical protein